MDESTLTPERAEALKALCPENRALQMQVWEIEDLRAEMKAICSDAFRPAALRELGFT